MPDKNILEVRKQADRLFDMPEIEHALDRMAQQITGSIADRNPLVLVVMTGGMIPAAMLLARLEFPLEVEYIHLSRYGDKTTGGEIRWIRRPPDNLRGRTVLLVDDLLDHGVTLKTAQERCFENGAKDVLTAVLVVKSISDRTGLQRVDFFGLEAADRYLFGMGMDYKSYWRNGSAIYAVTD
jgi:hypoxanthine phosphoribosyltransferase